VVVRIEIMAQAKNTHFTINPSIRMAPRRREIIWSEMFLDSSTLISIFVRIPCLHRSLFKAIPDRAIPYKLLNKYRLIGDFFIC